MALRGITEAEVELTLSQFDVRYPDRDGNTCYVALRNDRWIRVVVARDTQPPHIVTVIVV